MVRLANVVSRNGVINSNPLSHPKVFSTGAITEVSSGGEAVFTTGGFFRRYDHGGFLRRSNHINTRWFLSPVRPRRFPLGVRYVASRRLLLVVRLLLQPEVSFASATTEVSTGEVTILTPGGFFRQCDHGGFL